MSNNFKEEDKQYFIDFLNMVATKAHFSMNTQEIIQYYKLLSHMQQVLLPKINSHILEVVRVVEQEPKEAKKSRSRKK